MKTCQTKRCAWMRTLLMVVSTTYTSMALALAYNDVTAWWHFDCDADQNERADMSEIRDQRDWGTSALKGASGYHATSVNGGLGAPSWTNEVVSPAGGTLYGGFDRLSLLVGQTHFNPVSAVITPGKWYEAKAAKGETWTEG